MIFSNSPVSLMKKNEMNTTENSPTKALLTSEATEPTKPETLLTLTTSLILSMISATMSKSSPRPGNKPMSHWLKASTGFELK